MPAWWGPKGFFRTSWGIPGATARREGERGARGSTGTSYGDIAFGGGDYRRCVSLFGRKRAGHVEDHSQRRQARCLTQRTSGRYFPERGSILQPHHQIKVRKCGLNLPWRSKACHAAAATQGMGLSHAERTADSRTATLPHDVCPSLRSSLTEWIRVSVVRRQTRGVDRSHAHPSRWIPTHLDATPQECDRNWLEPSTLAPVVALHPGTHPRACPNELRTCIFS